MPRPTVRLLAIDEAVLLRLLATAVDDADPAEVMAPVAGVPGWTPARRDSFVAYHRAHRPSARQRPVDEVTWAVEMGGDVTGALRLAAAPPDASDPSDCSDSSELEVGLWLGRSYRGRGIGTAALAAAGELAGRLGARSLMARTTSSNVAALAALANHGFRLTDRGAQAVVARLVLEQAAEPPANGRD